MIRYQQEDKKSMNNRLFLYSALVFVSILLFDAWDRDYSAPNLSKQSTTHEIPETKTSKDNKKIQIDTPKPTQKQNEKFINVTTDTLKIKISLKDGAITYAELLNYPVAQGKEKNKVKVIDLEKKNYIARIGLQGKNNQTLESLTLP